MPITCIAIRRSARTRSGSSKRRKRDDRRNSKRAAQEGLRVTTVDHSRISEALKERIRSLHRRSPGYWQDVLAVLMDQSHPQSELQPSLLAALNVRITYDLVNALHKMDASSEALARRLVWLTWVLVICTAVL